MADTMRWRYGDTNPVVTKPITSGVTIEIGDLVGQDSSGNITPAAALAWTTDLPTTQTAFHGTFLGVAMQRSGSTDTDPIRVATSGVFEMACASATFNIGDLVGPDKNVGNLLLSQQVVAVVPAATKPNPSGASPATSIRRARQCWSRSSAPSSSAAPKP